MNSHLHPIFQTALRGIAPPADAKHWQAINAALCLRLKLYDAPRPPRGQFAYTYRHPELGALDCHMEGERGDPECGQRDTATLYSAYLRGVDIADRLTDDEVEAIELAAVKQPREIEEPA
jgi:hypothetical protein